MNIFSRHIERHHSNKTLEYLSGKTAKVLQEDKCSHDIAEHAILSWLKDYPSFH
jgi:hypothetical protein